jgi:hypothetical protein
LAPQAPNKTLVAVKPAKRTNSRRETFLSNDISISSFGTVSFALLTIGSVLKVVIYLDFGKIKYKRAG